MSKQENELNKSPLLEELPPVKPPSGTYILQLFLIPSVIVAAIFLVVGLFGMLVDSGADPLMQVSDLLHSNPQKRWRAAHALANLLAADRRATFGLRQYTNNRDLAISMSDTLKDILDKKTQVGATDSEEDIILRTYLVTALGMFDHPDGFEVLVRATENDVTEVKVKAVESLGLLADRNPEMDMSVLKEYLTVLSKDRESVVRKMCAYVMGVVADEDFIGDPPDRPGPLVSLLEDDNRDVTYNAATALARMGSGEGLGILNRMLTANVDRPDILQEKEVGLQAFKADTLVIGALQSMKQLISINNQVDMSSSLPHLELLTQSKILQIQVVAVEIKRLIENR